MQGVRNQDHGDTRHRNRSSQIRVNLISRQTEPVGERQFVRTQTRVTELTEAMESLVPKEKAKKPTGKAAEVTETSGKQAQEKRLRPVSRETQMETVCGVTTHPRE